MAPDTDIFEFKGMTFRKGEIQARRRFRSIERVYPELCEDEGCPHHGTNHVCNSAPDIDGKVSVDVSYTEIGMILGALNVFSLKVNGPRHELVQREINQLRANLVEQVQEKVPGYTRPQIVFEQKHVGNPCNCSNPRRSQTGKHCIWCGGSIV